MIKDLLKDSVKYLPAQVVPVITAFISIPIITRLFSPADYGNYCLVMATVMILTTLVGWLTMSIIRFYPAYERDKKLDCFYGNTIKLTFVSILVITLIFLIFLSLVKTHISSGLYLLMYVGIGVFVITGIFNVFQYFLRAKRWIIWYSSFVVWKSIVSIGIALLLIFFLKRGVESLLWGTILSVVIILPLLWKKVKEGSSALHFKIDFTLTKEMAKYSFPLVVGNLAAWILSLSDRYIINFFRGAQELGIYSASYDISDRSIYLFGSLIFLASGPIGTNIWEKEGIEKSREFISKLARYYLIICFPAVAGLSVLAKPIVSVLTAQEYYEGYRIVPLVALGGLFLGLQGIFNAGLYFYKRSNYVMFAVIASGLLNLVLNFLLVPRYGYTAAATTTLISYIFLLALIIIGSRRFFIWDFPFKSLVKVVCASGVMAAVVYQVGNSFTFSAPANLILGICIGVLIYMVMLFLLQEPQKKEIETLQIIRDKVLRRC